MQFKNKVCSVLEAVEEGFVFIGGTEAAAEVEHCVIIIQRQRTEKVLQLFEPLPNLRWVGFVGLRVGLIDLVQDGFALAGAAIKFMRFYVNL